MKNKLLVIILIVLGAALVLYGYNQFLAPKAVEGAKEVTIEVVVEKNNIDETFTFNTDHDFLYNLVKEKEEELGAIFKKYDFGTMITGMKGYEADESKNEYFHIYVNGEDATVGPEEIPLKDGDNYKFELKSW